MLRSVLLSLFLGITAGCATSPEPFPTAVECEKPELRGDTWADIAILSVEQSAAIDICNIRNGVDTYRSKYSEARSLSIRVPSPRECRLEGIGVPDGSPVTGGIRSAMIIPPGEGRKYCRRVVESGNIVGCTIPAGNHMYDIKYENYLWIKKHEACHAYYEKMDHMQWYLDSRD